jgi:hypothetical protein
MYGCCSFDVGALAEAGWPSVGPGVCPALRYARTRLQARPSSAGQTARRCCLLVPLQPAVLATGRPANNSPSKRHRALLHSPSSVLKQVCGTPLRGATFQWLRPSLHVTVRQPATLLRRNHRALSPACEGVLVEQHRAFSRSPLAVLRRTPRCLLRSPCGEAGRRTVTCRLGRRAWKVAARSAVQQICLSSELGASKALGAALRASYLLAFQDRAPQGTLAQRGQTPGPTLGFPAGAERANAGMKHTHLRSDKTSLELP